jgi:hypothetical protein
MNKQWRLKTWHKESGAVAALLIGALVASGRADDWREWVAALGVQFGFHHASVANRLQEAEVINRVEMRTGAYVECVRWLERYWVGKEIAWVVYFLATGAVSALVGCAVFIAHPFWRRRYRARQLVRTMHRAEAATVDVGRVVNGLDVWWVCTKPNCTTFYDNPQERDAHAATCLGRPEIPF